MNCPCLNPRKRRNPSAARSARTLKAVQLILKTKLLGLERRGGYTPSNWVVRPKTYKAAVKRLRAARRRNATLQVVLPNARIRGYAGRGGARVRGGQNLTNPRFVSASYARTFPGFAKALAGFKRFHGYAPSHFTVTRIKTSGPANTRRAVFMVGEAPAIEYRTWRYAKSKKSHTKDGRRILWRHKMGELGGKVPYWVHDPVSGVTSALGGTYKVTDFYRH